MPWPVRLFVGLLKGVLVGGVIGYAVAAAGLAVLPAWLAYPLAAGVGALIATVAGKPIWATNWNWNALPTGWEGASSIWGTVAAVEREQYLLDGFTRVGEEWPWMGHMFLHEWEPEYEPDDPR
ncbi:MAG: hypothetical protein AAGA56_28265, partial [Myxococcota bacterium]